MLVQSLVDMINQHEILNINEIDLLRDVKTHTFTLKEQKLFIMQDFKSYDQYTQQVILLHHTLNKQGHLCAVHCKRSSDVFVCIGGFNNLLPIFDKIRKSNLLDVARTKPGQVIGKIFKILNSLID